MEALKTIADTPPAPPAPPKPIRPSLEKHREKCAARKLRKNKFKLAK